MVVINSRVLLLCLYIERFILSFKENKRSYQRA